MSIDISCPKCSHEFDLLHARDDDDWRELIEMILALSPVVHRCLWAYLGLFKGKSKLRTSKMMRIVKQLSPMIQSAQVERSGNSYLATPQMFASAMDSMVNAPPATLVLPLKGNGYLLSILANTAETNLQKTEQKAEQKKRTPYRNIEVPAAEPEATVRQKASMPTDFREVASKLNPAIKQRLNDEQN